jgi:5-methylthioribose kinase
MPSRAQADLALFAGNVELCDITEALVLPSPTTDAPPNRHTPGLGPCGRAAADATSRSRRNGSSRLRGRAETLLHGDLHTGLA